MRRASKPPLRGLKKLVHEAETDIQRFGWYEGPWPAWIEEASTFIRAATGQPSHAEMVAMGPEVLIKDLVVSHGWPMVRKDGLLILGLKPEGAVKFVQGVQPKLEF